MKVLSKFIFPYPDPTFVRGTGNTSYWLILFVKSELLSSWKAVYYACIVVEVLHPNMILISNNFFLTFHIGSLARICLIVFETRVIQLPCASNFLNPLIELNSDLGSTPVPHLGVLRMFSISQAFCYICLSTLERVISTVLVDDYEKRPWYRTAVVIVISLNISMLAISICLVTGVVNGYFTCLLAILPCFCYLGMHRILIKRNKRRLDKLAHTLKRSANDHYSLSVRAQLRENLWTLQRIEFGMYVVAIALVANIAVFIIPILIIDEDQMETLQWCQAVGNLTIAVSITCGVPMVTFALAMHTRKLPFYARWYLRLIGQEKMSVIKVEKKGTEDHFTQLHSQWDLAMRRVFFLLLGVYLHGKGTLLIWRHKALHSNLILIYTNYYFSFNIGSIARSIMSIFETRLIQLDYLGSFPVPQLGVVRMYSVVHVFCYLYFATLERVFATLLVKDYEKEQRQRFAIGIILSLDLLVLVVSFFVVAGALNGYICCFTAILPCIGCLGILRILLKRNRKSLSTLGDTLKRSSNDHYSLSLRMQLRENVWTIQKIEFGMYIIVVELILNLLFILVPIFVLTEENQMEALQWCQWASNIIIAVSISCSVPMATFALAMQTGNLPVYARWYLRIFGQAEEDVVKVESKETDEYFTQLHNQWNLAIRKERTR